MSHPIRPYHPDDLPQLLQIYNHAIEFHTATFEETPLSECEFGERLAGIASQFPLLVIEHDGQVAGYAYGNHYKTRSAYRFCAETTIYLAPEQQGKGLALPLYQALLQALQSRGITQVLAVITSPNPTSEALHRKLGYEPVGLMRSVGFKFENWHDVAIWQRALTPDAVSSDKGES
ncbi:GNAT family N-acetyltransferase [Ferrimonas marina]|uniref:Phosphinothricin acetyltransferase n=1 Tax=Ferrimonas marina TaxID=299255 RepID=A0A1M5X5B1_9GAMM|nr:GNAT family N-acetyltransferase [Ferrimonas marina]SHH95006.1 phosphinothricin acetyltransferase [Ferrimonas marina]